MTDGSGDEHAANEQTRARWRDAYAERAREYWTEARTSEFARGKRLRLPPAEASTLLRALGLLNRNASMPPERVRKYWQINHMLALTEPTLRQLYQALPTPRPLRLIDAGCGRSYLTLLLAFAGGQPGGTPTEVLGIDRNPDVIDECRRRTYAAGLSQLVRHVASDLSTVDVLSTWQHAFGATADSHLDGVVALHACDTATCDAIELGVRLRASLIAVAPCCQAELGRGWSELAASPSTNAPDAFASIRSAPHLRREIAAHITDAMRTLLLRSVGYQAQPIELAPDEHTRKNTLIRALSGAQDPSARYEYQALVTATGGVGLALQARLDALN